MKSLFGHFQGAMDPDVQPGASAERLSRILARLQDQLPHLSLRGAPTLLELREQFVPVPEGSGDASPPDEPFELWPEGE